MAGNKPTRMEEVAAPLEEPVITRDRFSDIVAELLALHDAKTADYGRKEDSYQNFRTSIDVGVPPWIGAFIRLKDKVQRISKFARTGNLKNEGVIDSFNDLAVYAIICRILYEESASETQRV